MIERGQFVDTVDEWYISPLATPCDGLLCAFVSLRLFTADVPGLLRPKDSGLHGHNQNYRPLMKIMEDQISRWQRQWTEILERGTVSSPLPTKVILTDFRAMPLVPDIILWRTYSSATFLPSFTVLSLL